MQDIPVLKDVGAFVIPPANAEAPPLESTTVQAADVMDELVFCLAPSCQECDGLH